MTDFRLDNRYSSEDMYRDFPHLRPGDTIAVEVNGQLYTDTVTSVRHTSATPEITRRLSWFGRIVRRLTPKLFRKSLVIKPAQPPTTVITTGDLDDDVRESYERAMASLQQAGEIISGLLECGPPEEYRGQ